MEGIIGARAEPTEQRSATSMILPALPSHPQACYKSGLNHFTFSLCWPPQLYTTISLIMYLLKGIILLALLGIQTVALPQEITTRAAGRKHIGQLNRLPRAI